MDEKPRINPKLVSRIFDKARGVIDELFVETIDARLRATPQPPADTVVSA